jgi:hypothetical protein
VLCRKIFSHTFYDFPWSIFQAIVFPTRQLACKTFKLKVFFVFGGFSIVFPFPKRTLKLDFVEEVAERKMFAPIKFDCRNFSLQVSRRTSFEIFSGLLLISFSSRKTNFHLLRKIYTESRASNFVYLLPSPHI